MNKMKTLTLQGTTFEVVDEAARNEIAEVKNNVENLPKVEPVQPDWNQNDPNAPDYVKNRTHYTKLMYSDTYIDYFDVSPIKAGMGLFPLVIPKEGKESFDFKAFFDPDFLQRAYTTSGRRMKFAINNILKNSVSNTSSTMNSASAFLNKRTFIDDKNFMVAINPTNGFDIYAICDTSTLTDSYKDMFAKKGVYLHITKEPTVNSGYYFDSVSFKVLEYVPIDEGYIPLNVPKVDSKAAVGQTIVVKSVNSAGQPTEWEAADLPSTAINNGYSKDEVYNKNEADDKFLTKETIAKPDWKQNDPNAADYVKNRTHWREVVENEVEYVPEQTVEITLNANGMGTADITYVGIGESNASYIEDGKHYKVLFDGVAYDVVGSNSNIGNMHITNASETDTGEPFRIMIRSSASKVFCKVAGTHTLSVTRIDEEIIYHKIPDEYLPDTVNLTVVTADGQTKTFRLYGREITDET